MFPERAMTRCTAIHAEVRAILNAGGEDLGGCHMYATTMPCFLCAEQILQAGITRVVYFEPYPDTDAEVLLREHGVIVTRFEGVKSLAFTRFFGNWRQQAEKEMAMEP
jgi:deoxycytidylate deaminase